MPHLEFTQGTKTSRNLCILSWHTESRTRFTFRLTNLTHPSQAQPQIRGLCLGTHCSWLTKKVRFKGTVPPDCPILLVTKDFTP